MRLAVARAWPAVVLTLLLPWPSGTRAEGQGAVTDRPPVVRATLDNGLRVVAAVTEAHLGSVPAKTSLTAFARTALADSTRTWYLLTEDDKVMGWRPGTWRCRPSETPEATLPSETLLSVTT
jgi:hypothetical protein